jgi:glycosyltransferase involved in cell wall biosynthesis
MLGGAKKVLMLGWELPPRFAGGVGIVCGALTRALAERGLEVTYLMPQAEPQGAARGVRVIGAERIATLAVPSRLHSYASSAPPVSVPGEAAPPDGRPLYGADLLDAVERFSGSALDSVAAESLDFDLIHAHDWTTFPAGLALRERSGVPLVVHVHITEFDKSGGLHADPRVYAIERAGMRGADLVVTVSQRVADTCVARYGVDPARIRVVYNGVDSDRGDRGPGLPLRPLVLFLGRVTLQKGPEYFLRAAQRVLELEPAAHFVLAGTGDQLPRMIEYAAELGLGPRVLFPGFVDRDRAAELYASADVFVMPSVSEPFGIVPLEAMDRGVPVIVSRQSGVSEVLQHALKVDFWDVDDLAGKIVAALRYTGLTQQLRSAGRDEVAGLSWESVAEQTHRLYEEVARA